MNLSINGNIIEANYSTLEEWISAEFGSPAANVKGIAFAVNDKVVPKSKWASFNLQNNDRILAIEATQGG
ncbi:MAG: sulfur carrier protein ThiS [Fibromonadaceae bacterium]|nr:sulfur carrier protein ThiS [Fibromonadaceae bacterium]